MKTLMNLGTTPETGYSKGFPFWGLFLGEGSLGVMSPLFLCNQKLLPRRSKFCNMSPQWHMVKAALRQTKRRMKYFSP